MREKIAILPKLFDYSGDISKKWYIYFSVRSPRSGKMVVKKIYKGLFIHKSKKKRYEAANQIIEKYTQMLRAGYNFLEDESTAIYTDSLQYHNTAQIYKQQKKANRSFNYFACRFIDQHSAGLEHSTILTYKSKLRIFNTWLMREGMDDADITAIDNPVILKFFEFLNIEKKSSGVTYKKYKNTLHILFEYILDQKAIAYNPVQRITKCLRVVDEAPKAIHLDHLQEIVKRLKEQPALYLFAMFEYYCFLRPGREIRMMKISWIDVGTGIIRIPKSFNKTKIDKNPIIPDEFLRILMEDYNLHTYPKDFYVFGRYGEPGILHLGKNTMAARFMKIRRELNLPADYMLYSFKHTGNSMLRRSGANGYERQMQNGHTSLRTTEIYSNDKFGFESEHIRKHFPSLNKKPEPRGPGSQNL
jgi:integrase